MKKVLLVFLILIGLAIGGGIYVWNKAEGTFNEIVNTVNGGEIAKPNLDNWGKLQKGMTIAEAQELLGPSITYTVTINGVETTYLIYTYSEGLLSAPSDKSHNLEFNSEGKLVQWNEPKVILAQNK